MNSLSLVSVAQRRLKLTVRQLGRVLRVTESGSEGFGPQPWEERRLRASVSSRASGPADTMYHGQKVQPSDCKLQQGKQRAAAATASATVTVWVVLPTAAPVKGGSFSWQ